MPKNSDPFEGEPEAEADISPMIDVAFLLLIYFIVTTTLQKQEADLSLTLPGVSSDDSKKVKIKQTLIVIDPAGVIFVNGEPADSDPSDRTVPILADRLERYAASTALAQAEPQIIIDCNDESMGQRFVDVLNACAKAKIKNISLAN
jgi:biopolymer transport protein ExbD